MNQLVITKLKHSDAEVIRHLTMVDMYRNHVQERHIPKGGDPMRMVYTARPVLDFFGWERDPSTLKRQDFRDYEGARRAKGISGASIRRELTILQAAYNHNVDEERIVGRLRISTMPQKSAPRRRVWTEEEAARLMATPMPRRVMLFYVVAFGTGARAQAIEQLTWDRIDFPQNIVDFNVPGMRITNKRRPRAPMSKDFAEQMRVVYDDPDRDPSDPYVIGMSERGTTSSTYHACRKVVEAAGLKETGVCRHVCRKCYVSWRLKKGKPLAKIAALIADNPATAAASYGFMQPKHLQDTADL